MLELGDPSDWKASWLASGRPMEASLSTRASVVVITACGSSTGVCEGEEDFLLAMTEPVFCISECDIGDCMSCAKGLLVVVMAFGELVYDVWMARTRKQREVCGVGRRF